MSNIYDYLEQYGNITFEQLSYTEVDNIIFSQIVYLNFEGIIGNRKIRLQDVANKFINKKYKHVNRKRINLLTTIKDMKRYQNLLLSNYIYKLTEDEQFGALLIEIEKDLACISFEGTDNMIVGWKEDFSLAYQDFIPAQKDAIKYLNKVGKKYKNLIITGHSKGGNLAIISAIYANRRIKNKITKIYSLDGPGIKEAHLKTYKFKKIKDKYIKIIPKYSIIGKLFDDEVEEVVVDCKEKGIGSHSVFNWKIKDKNFKRDQISKFSIDLDYNFTMWMNSYNQEEIKYFCYYIFNLLNTLNIKTTYDLKALDKDQYKKILIEIKSKDPIVVKMLEEFLHFIKNYYIQDAKNHINKVLDKDNKTVKNNI